MHFIADKEKEMQCTFGNYYSYDGHIEINLAMMDSPEEVMVTIIHEELHAFIKWATDPLETTEDQDHFIIPRMFC